MEGSRAPPFDLPRDGGTHVSLADFAGRKLVIFFYPRADTPGCTREAMDFTRLAKEFAACGTAVLGVSADPTKAQDSFRTKHKLSMPLISDEKHEMLEAYGAWREKSMYGRTFLGILRTTVLVDEEGRIARIWRRVKVDGHAEAACTPGGHCSTQFRQPLRKWVRRAFRHGGDERLSDDRIRGFVRVALAEVDHVDALRDEASSCLLEPDEWIGGEPCERRCDRDHERTLSRKACRVR